MTSMKSKTTLLWLVLLLGFSGIWELQHAIDARRAALHQEEDDVVLRWGPLLKVMSLEYAPLMADLYWTRVVQYYGDKHAREDANIQLLWPLLDVTTTLDPNLIVAYRFGSTFLSEPAPRGAGRPDLGIKLLERGIQANPEFWRFYEDLGFIYYFNLQDYRKAAEVFLEGSKRPGALIWMKAFAARISELPETHRSCAEKYARSAEGRPNSGSRGGPARLRLLLRCGGKSATESSKPAVQGADEAPDALVPALHNRIVLRGHSATHNSVICGSMIILRGGAAAV